MRLLPIFAILFSSGCSSAPLANTLDHLFPSQPTEKNSPADAPPQRRPRDPIREPIEIGAPERVRPREVPLPPAPEIELPK